MNHQLRLPIDDTEQVDPDASYRERLDALLSKNLDFHDQQSTYASHNFHAFPAKFPPQLPRAFINALTDPGDVVLDPMMGSGTTILEAFLLDRQGIGFDIDPLALKIAKAKVTPLKAQQVEQLGRTILEQARLAAKRAESPLQSRLAQTLDPETRQFIDYWFAAETQLELLALLEQIAGIDHAAIRAYFELAFSAIIVTKSGGVSLALDLAHTRPHRAKIILRKDGSVLLGDDLTENPSPRVRLLTKTLRSPIDEFEKRLQQNLKGILSESASDIQPAVGLGNAERLPLRDSSVDLVVTSPPYASNAIDYMRAHKFALVWLGYPVDDLSHKRRDYIGAEALNGQDLVPLPARVNGVIAGIAALDKKKGRVLQRYYSEVSLVLREMFRVLKSGKAAIVVVGSSIMRSRDTETGECLADIGRSIGFEVPRIGVRSIDRDRRMLPSGSRRNRESQIQQRMHEEYVIGFYKP